MLLHGTQVGLQQGATGPWLTPALHAYECWPLEAQEEGAVSLFIFDAQGLQSAMGCKNDTLSVQLTACRACLPGRCMALVLGHGLQSPLLPEPMQLIVCRACAATWRLSRALLRCWRRLVPPLTRCGWKEGTAPDTSLF